MKNYDFSWNEHTYDDIYPFSSTPTGSHFGGAVINKNNFYLVGGYRYENVSSIVSVEVEHNTG